MTLVETLLQIAKLAKYYKIDKPYIVGGVPRDLYLKREVKTSDIDITTNSFDSLRLAVLTADNLDVSFDISDDGHAVVFSDFFDLDFSSHFVSPAVMEYLPEDKRKYAEVFSRDFTINTLHQDLETKEIFDFTGMGFSDCENKIIKTPVPPEITFTDDPRRIYRAVNLAARYGYTIDQSIVKYVKENPDTFKSIKEKYISLKISKALKENKELTIQLLKELNLFHQVPLVGTFKNVLIDDNLLFEYLNRD
jgi:tRNA nucleotidyltransferase/poly(A) polymerase